MLYPFESTRGKIGRATQSRSVLQNLKIHVRDFKANGKLVLVTVFPAAYGKDLASDLPDMRFAPLFDISGGRQLFAKGVELFFVRSTKWRMVRTAS